MINPEVSEENFHERAESWLSSEHPLDEWRDLLNTAITTSPDFRVKLADSRGVGTSIIDAYKEGNTQPSVRSTVAIIEEALEHVSFPWSPEELPKP